MRLGLGIPGDRPRSKTKTKSRVLTKVMVLHCFLMFFIVLGATSIHLSIKTITFVKTLDFFLLLGLSPGIPRQPQSHTHPYYSLKTLITYVAELYHYICWLAEVLGSV